MSDTRPCPACAEPIAAAALKCRWCGDMLAAPPSPNDLEHLRLLSIFHYVSGGLTAFVACFPLIHVAVGLAFVLAPETISSKPQGDAPPAWFGLLFIAVGGFFVLAGWTLAILKIIAGRCLARRRRRAFCVVVACVCCVLPPLGTILGVFTLIVLNRPSVKALFEAPR